MNAPETRLHAREAPHSATGATYGVRVLLAFTFTAVLWSEYRGWTPAAAPWSAWMLLLSGVSLLASSLLQPHPATTLAALSTLTTKLHLASTLRPAAGRGARRLLEPGALLTALAAVPVVALGCMAGECEGPGCFPAESWAALAGILAGFSTLMDLVFVGVSLHMVLKRPFDPRERRGEALAIACGAAAFAAGLMKLTTFAPLSTSPTLHGPLLLWTAAESCLTILSATAMAPHTAHEGPKRPRSPPVDDDAQEFGLGREERGEASGSESEVLRRSMVRAGLL